MSPIVLLPSGRYRVGAYRLRPLALGFGVTDFFFALDKTRWDDPRRTVDVVFDLSFDGGRTWNQTHHESDPFPCGFTGEGGGEDRFGHQRLFVGFFPSFVPQPMNARRIIRGRLVVAGGTIETEGTVLLTMGGAVELAA